ncbi:MAG TPA: HRDC domain-containing protein [Solirubrobacteraceae bacterium]|nr:HRDC domain-containing protein [Solirubrobacteraceae bacterium]
MNIAELARAAGRIALDTEFMGEGRYRTLLCLVQLAVAEPADGTGNTGSEDGEHPKEGHERIEILDPLREEWLRQPLAEAIADPAVELVVHAGRQDIALLRRALGCEVRNVFDTQVAAGFLGMGAQCSYDTLLAELLGVKLSKSASFTRWDARPLTGEQLDYARDDVVHLSALAIELQHRLDKVGRLRWAREECEFLERVSDERNLDAIFERLPRVRSLNAASQGVARELVAWRERMAAERDRPVQSVLGDAALVEIAKRKPSSPRKLQDIRGVGQGSLRRGGEDLLAAVQRGLESSHPPLAGGPRTAPPRPDDAPLIALAEALVRARAREADVAYELLASRADLQAIVAVRRDARAGRDSRGEADVRTLRGWRRELVGEELLALLDGRMSLSVQDARLQIDPI